MSGHTSSRDPLVVYKRLFHASFCDGRSVIACISAAGGGTNEAM